MVGDYKPNSHKFKEDQQTGADERKKVEKVVKGTVKTRRNDMRKLTDIFISKDVQDVKSYMLFDIIVPAVKDVIEDIVTNGIRMILRGESGARKSSSKASTVSYTKYYDSRDTDRRRDSDRPKSGYFSYDDFVFENRGEAEEVLTHMFDLIETYGMVRVADLYELVGKSGPYTNNNYGWVNLRNAEVVRVRDGYIIKLPRALPLD